MDAVTPLETSPWCELRHCTIRHRVHPHLLECRARVSAPEADLQCLFRRCITGRRIRVILLSQLGIAERPDSGFPSGPASCSVRKLMRRNPGPANGGIWRISNSTSSSNRWVPGPPRSTPRRATWRCWGTIPARRISALNNTLQHLNLGENHGPQPLMYTRPQFQVSYIRQTGDSNRLFP